MAVLDPAPSALDTSRPFTTTQALAAGITAKQLRSRAYRRLAKGKYVSAQRAIDALLHAESALLGHPEEAFVSHTTAARVYHLPVPEDPVLHVSVFEPGRRRARQGTCCHVAAKETQVLTFRGIRIAAPAYVFLELASTLTLVDMVVLGDAMVRKEWYSPAQLVAVCRTSRSEHTRAVRWRRRCSCVPVSTHPWRADCGCCSSWRGSRNRR